MRISGTDFSKRYRFVLLVALLLSLTAVTSQSADAKTGGSWGSSRGGFASGGSFGSRGGRAPVRGLLGRIGSRFRGGSMGSYGSFGGSIGGRSFGSYGGWSGSTGGWGSAGSPGSTGTSYASSGSYYGSAGISLTSYAASSSGAAYGSWGSSYLSNYGSTSAIVSAPIVSAPMGSYQMQQSYPIGNYGFDSSYPVTEQTIPQGYVQPGYIGDAPPAGQIMSGGSIDSMLNGGIPIEEGTIVPDSTTPGFYGSGAPISPAPAPNGSADPQPEPGSSVEPPGPVEDDGTSTTRPRTDSSVLNLVLPEEAQVYINGKLTKTAGAMRSYVSRNLTEDRDYKYQVKAVLVRDGNELVRTELVTLRPGLDKTVRLKFEEPVTTTLALNVPENATVKLCGKVTNASGSTRMFATQSLQDGKTWKDYKVSVEFERDGKTHAEERSIDMVAGESYTLAFGVAESKPARIAAR